MATSILSSLQKASFRGVPFLIEGVSTKGGRKTVTHEFINSNKRSVEDLGALQNIFSLTALISARNELSGETEGSSYIRKRNALINALNRKGSGILIHPYYGRVTVVAKPYTIDERINELGLARFQLNFERAESKISPLPSVYTLSAIFSRSLAVFSTLGADVVATQNVSRSFPLNFTALTDQFTDIEELFDSATKTFNRVTDQIDEFQSRLNDFKNNIRRFVNLPNELVNSVKGLFNSVVALAETPRYAVSTLERFFGFGDDNPIFSTLTAARQEKKTNQDNINLLIQTGALIESYPQVASIEFKTLDELETFANKLNTQFNKVFPLITNPVTANDLQTLQSISSEFLDRQRLTVRRVIDINTSLLPAQAIVYQYYGNLDDYETIIALNSTKDMSFVEGSTSILTSPATV